MRFWVVGFGDFIQGEKGELLEKNIYSPNLSTQSFSFFTFPPLKGP